MPSSNRDLRQQDGWKTQDGRMTKKCRTRPEMHCLVRHFFVILPSWVFQPSCCVMSLIDHRWHQNVIRAKKGATRAVRRLCHWCSHHIMTSSLIYYWTGTRQHGIYLSHSIKKWKKVPVTSFIHLSSNKIIDSDQSKRKFKVTFHFLISLQLLLLILNRMDRRWTNILLDWG